MKGQLLKINKNTQNINESKNADLLEMCDGKIPKLWLSKKMKYLSMNICIFVK